MFNKKPTPKQPRWTSSESPDFNGINRGLNQIIGALIVAMVLVCGVVMCTAWIATLNCN